MRIKYRLFTLALPLVMLFAFVPNYNVYGIKGVSANKMKDNSYKIEINCNDYRQCEIANVDNGQKAYCGERLLNINTDLGKILSKYSFLIHRMLMKLSLQYGETTSEAVAMKQYLISKGIPEKAVLTENRSTSTYTNLNNSKQILDNYFDTEYTVVIVTNRYHTFRAAKIAQKAGMNFSVLCADTPPAEIPLRYLRECASICKYCFITMLEFFKVHK